jgi:hypothetical protein
MWDDLEVASVVWNCGPSHVSFFPKDPTDENLN